MQPANFKINLTLKMSLLTLYSLLLRYTLNIKIMAQITLKGNPVQTISKLPELGLSVRDFALVNEKLEVKTLSDYDGKRKIFNIFPSIDTGICAESARKFNEKAGELENAVVINVSKDLPFALGRFCAAEGLNHVESLSDFRGTFGDDYGLTMMDSPMKGLLSRAVIVTDETGKIIYKEQVPEIAQEPDYESALNALK